MPLKNKAPPGQNGASSPTPSGEVVNRLLHVKDTVNSTLIVQHKKTSNLTNVLSEVEDQIREVTEQTLRNIKSDIEKNKRKVLPGIKRLQDCLKGLSKSENKIKQGDRGGRNADTKKAKRRIKDAQKLIQEFGTRETDYEMTTCLADHITQLCKRLMQLTIKLSTAKLEPIETPRNEKSDTDSEDNFDSKPLERSRTPNHIYEEIDQFQVDDTYLKPNGRSQSLHERSCEVPPLLLRNLSPGNISRLNSVHLFSSESDSSGDDFNSKTFMPFNLEPRSRSPLIRKAKNTQQTPKERKYVRKSRSPKPQNNEYGFERHISPKSEKRKAVLISEHPTEDKHETHFHPSLQAPIDQYIEHMSTSPENQSSHHEIPTSNCLTFTTRSTPKRLLPAIPKPPAEDVFDAAQTRHEEGGTTANYFRTKTNNFQTADDISLTNQRHSERREESSDRGESVDREEMEFRKTVRNARQEIIDRIKNRFHAGGKYISDNSSDERRDDSKTVGAHVNTNAKQKQSEFQSMQNWHSKEMDASGSDTSSVNKASGIYKSKLIHLGDTLPSTSNNSKESIVSSTIKKFETDIWKAELTYFKNARKSKKLRASKTLPHFRSASEPRRSISSLHSRSDFTEIKSPFKNNALKPKNESGYSTLNESDKDKFDDSANESLNNSLLLRSCTENDLNDLVEKECPSSIRRQWSKRRSSSLNARVPRATQAPIKQGHVYEKETSFYIPDHVTRCHAAAINVLDSGNIIILDERHFYIHLFSGDYSHIQELKLYDIPRGCERIDGNKVAIALPYKKRVSIYAEENKHVKFRKDLAIPCQEWILDISFAKGLIYALCKGGHVHVTNEQGNDLNCLSIGMSGRLNVEPLGKSFYIISGRKITKFDINGKSISTKPDIDAYSMLFLENRVYVADRMKHRIRALTNVPDVQDLTEDKIEYPSAICTSKNGNRLYVSQYDESIDVTFARTITVYKLREIVTNV
ncbi:uncharacterized protein LOC128207400 [Mya arenaria]|uniref:uncharacterized protein LOC128207400 n=1 Tax=Mya arenaria TaxID=6604 RepID=UPI0022E7ED68|nr:uncharacterized protein LOC128207400 [Mya arenaria]